MVGTVSLGTFDSTMELRQSQAPYRQSTQSRPPRENTQSRTNSSERTCPPQKLPTTLQQAQDVRDALTRQSLDLDRLIARYEHGSTHSPKELDRLADRARCLREQFPGLQRPIRSLSEQALAKADYNSLSALQDVDNDLFNLELKEFRRALRLEGLKEDVRLEMLCGKVPQPRTIDMAENAPAALKGDIDYLKTRIDTYLANPTREQQKSIIDSMVCVRNVIKDLHATLDRFEGWATAADDRRTKSRISELRSVLGGLSRDIQAQDDRIR